MKAKHLLSALALGAVAALTLSGCGGDPLASGDGDKKGSSDADSIIIGSADFTESQLIATIYAKALEDAGVKVTNKLNIGAREVQYKALEDGSIDLVPEYSGALLAFLDPKATAATPADVITALNTKLPDTLTLLEASKAQDNDAVTVTKETAEKYNLKTISDLKAHAPEMVLGGPPEWETRYNGLVGLKELYGLNFKSFLALDAGGPLTMTALTTGQVQAADLFTTDPGIVENNLVALEDDKALLGSQEVVPLITKAKVSDKITKALNAVSAKLTTEILIDLNTKAATGTSLDSIASDWLKSVGLIK